MSLTTWATCDNPKCNTSVPVIHRVEAADLELDRAGWIVQMTSVPSTIAAGRVSVTRHYCSPGCQVAGLAADRARAARELVRR